MPWTLDHKDSRLRDAATVLRAGALRSWYDPELYGSESEPEKEEAGTRWENQGWTRLGQGRGSGCKARAPL